jgi:beta-lactamase class A
MVKKLLLLLIIVIGVYLVREGWYYLDFRTKMPVGTEIASIDVTGLTLEQAGEEIANRYSRPIYINGRGEQVELDPTEVGFRIDLSSMLNEAAAAHDGLEWWRGFTAYVIDRPLSPIIVDLIATHDDFLLQDFLTFSAEKMEDPAQPATVEPETLQFKAGKSGYSADIEATLPALSEALYSLDNRDVELILVDEEAPPFDFSLLQEVLENQVEASGLLGSLFILNLQTGEEISINADVALSGMSIVKIAIMLELFRAVDGPLDFDQQKLLNETAINSGNYSANLLLDVVAGQDNAYLGVDILTQSMQRLGLENTFITTPYEEPPRPNRPTLITPANAHESNVTDPDPNMQTTAEDMGSLLAMVYDCANGGGTLLAVYADQLGADECQQLLDVLALNVEGNLIRFGVPDTVPVAHKHGWATNTHGDAGIVFSPGGDYVVVEYLSQPGADWLVADYSFPILRDMSRIVYNYFNADDPYTGNALLEEQRFDEEEAAADASDEGETVAEEVGSNSAETESVPNANN